jgi:molybdopterin synthase sulfur carrier subunit
LKIKIKFFATFRELFQEEEREIDLQSGSNMRDLLNLLCDSSKLREQVFDDGKLRPYLNILKNGQNIHHLKGLETGLEEGDTVDIFPPIGGGGLFFSVFSLLRLSGSSKSAFGLRN